MDPTWKEALHNRKFLSGSLACLICLAVLGSFAPNFFQNIIQKRNGFQLDDFVLDMFDPKDWSLEIMAILYASLIISIVSNYSKPGIILLCLTTYCTVSWIRIVCIYWVALDPPRGVIPLTDPILSTIVYHQLDFVKDLYFSGHISTMSVLVFCEPKRELKWLFTAMAVVMSVLILAQHVHYTIDILFAPPITYGAYLLTKNVFVKRLLPD